MADITELKRTISSLKKGIQGEMSMRIAQSMLRETHLNIDKGAYMNDGHTEKWDKRLYDIKKTPSGRYLGYKALKRTMRLYKGYEPFVEAVGKITRIGIRTNVEYAQLQNEGGKATGRWVQPEYKIDRKPPTIKARRHAGVGSRTMTRSKKEIERLFKKYLK